MIDARGQQRTFDLLGIRCTRIVSINLLGGRTLVEGDEPMEQVVACCVVVIAPGEVGEVVAKWRFRQLLREQIDLVKEQDLLGRQAESWSAGCMEDAGV